MSSLEGLSCILLVPVDGTSILELCAGLTGIIGSVRVDRGVLVSIGGVDSKLVLLALDVEGAGV